MAVKKRSAGKAAMFREAMSKEPRRRGSVPGPGTRKPLPFGKKQPAGAANVKAPHSGKGPKPPVGRHSHRTLARASIKKQAAMEPDPGRALTQIPKPPPGGRKKKVGKANAVPS